MLYQLRLALISLRRNPVLSLLMVGGIGLGIAVAMTFVTAHYKMSADPLPSKSERLTFVQVDAWDPESPWDDADPTEPPNQLTYRDAMALLASDIPTYHSPMYRAEMSIVPDDPRRAKAPARWGGMTLATSARTLSKSVSSVSDFALTLTTAAPSERPCHSISSP